jgi:hypothetical protein
MLQAINKELIARRLSRWQELYANCRLGDAVELFYEEFKSCPTPEECKTTHHEKQRLQHVYFITDGQYVKIGFSGNVRGRLHDLQVASPRKLIIAGVVPYGTKSLEQELHQQFKHLRIRGEWFKIAPELTEYIQWLANSNLNTYGQPLSHCITEVIHEEL